MSTRAVHFPLNFHVARRGYRQLRPERPKPKQARAMYKKPVKCNIDIQEVSYYVGKSITLWVMFTSGLNWMMYRKIRKDNERDE